MNIRFSATAKEPVPMSIDCAPVVGEPDPDTGKDAVYGPPEPRDFMIPRLKRKHWTAWRQQIDAERIAEVQTVGITPEQTARLLLMYPLAPLTHREMQARAATVEGTGYIIRTCCEAAGVPAHAIARMVDDGDADEIELEQMAFMLAGLADPADVARKLAEQAAAQSTAQGGTPENEGEETDPFPRKPNALKT